MRHSSATMSTPSAMLRRPARFFDWLHVGSWLLFLPMIVALALLQWGGELGPAPLPVVAAPPARTAPGLTSLPGSPAFHPTAPQVRTGPSEARRMNAAVPFVTTVVPPAPPFRFTAGVIDRARAIDCLAVAAMAEAGQDGTGQRAVIQVILNRVRHPAFAKSVCGVVFQGSHRATGCQFTFTCDGALARRYGADAWRQSRARAAEALDGFVYAPVGLATHYHTDWVYPYWSASLTKVARVDTHLFFRWPGYWGSPAALTTSITTGEPAVAQLGYLPAHAGAPAALVAAQLAYATTPAATATETVVSNGDGGAFVLLSAAPSAQKLLERGRAICAGRRSCKVYGWFDRAIVPAGYPVPAAARARLGFSYFRDGSGAEFALYDCARFADAGRDACMPRGTGPRATVRAGQGVDVAGMEPQGGVTAAAPTRS